MNNNHKIINQQGLYPQSMSISKKKALHGGKTFLGKFIRGDGGGNLHGETND